MAEKFIDWDQLTHAERTEAIQAVPEPFLKTRIDLAMEKVQQVHKILEKDSQAQRLCHTLAIGFFLLNTPEQMAEYCRQKAAANKN